MSRPAGCHEADPGVGHPGPGTLEPRSPERIRQLAGTRDAVAAVILGRAVSVPVGTRVAGSRFGPFALSRVRLTLADCGGMPVQADGADRGDWTLAVRHDGAPAVRRQDGAIEPLGDVTVAEDAETAHESGLGPGDWLLLTFPESAWPKHSACPSGAIEGSGAKLFRDHLLALERHLPTAGERDREAFAEATRAMLSACLAGDVAFQRRSRSDAVSALEARVDTVIRENLSSARLDTARICSLAGVSRSALYRMFEGRGGVAAHVRSLRLALIHADLADPTLVAEPIQRIAERRGLFCTTSFNRAFRRAFGCTPGDVRAAATARANAAAPCRDGAAHGAHAFAAETPDGRSPADRSPRFAS